MGDPVRLPHRSSGFTLTEVMVVLTILGILLAIALPSFRSLIEDQRVKGAASELHASLVLARSEALKRNASVTLAPVGGDWSAGWRTAHPSAAGLFLDDHGPLNGLSVSGPAAVVYNRSGRLQVGADVSFTITGDVLGRTKCLSVDLGGLPTVEACS